MRRLVQRKKEGGRYAVRHARKAERVTMPVTTGDTVRVMRGEDAGKEGKILRVFPKTGRVTIEGINIVKRHRKARRAEEQSQIMETRVRYRRDDEGTKERIAVKSDQAIPRTR